MSVRSLSLLAGVGALASVPREVMNALQRVEIVSAIGERGSFRLSFRLDRGSTLPTRFLPKSGDLVRVVLSTGGGNSRAVVMDGVLVDHMVSRGVDSTSPVLVLAGEDLTLLMDLIETGSRPFPGMTIEARVEVILAAYAVLGVTPVVVRPPLEDVPVASERVFHQSGTDYAYIRSLAAKVGHRFTLDPGPVPGASVAYWGPEPRADRSRPSLVINFRRSADVELLRLRFDAMQRVAPEALTLEPVSKAAIPIPVPDIVALGTPLGASVPPAHRHRRLHLAAKLTPLQAAGALLAEAARSAEAMTGHGTLRVGRSRRRLRAGSIVEIRGAAEPFNGLFAVNRVHDTITARRHHQDFELVRAGLGAITAGGKP